MRQFILNRTRPDDAVEDVYGDWWLPCHIFQKNTHGLDIYYRWRLLTPKWFTWEKALQWSTRIDEKGLTTSK